MKWTASLLPLVILAAAPGLASAQMTTDPAGDWWTAVKSTGSVAYDGARTGDLDVVGVSATFNDATQTFSLVATMNGAIRTTTSAIYVWGVNTGSGAAGFASSGLNGVLFNKTIAISPLADGVAGVSVGTAGARASWSGTTITLIVPAGSLTATNGFRPTDYTWNLWPRDSTSGLAQAISDFAPDNSNIMTTAVPEPSSMALMLLGGVSLLAWRRRKTH